MDLTPPDPRIGMLLQERYRILERVASGAMGVVYRGERVSLGRAVAVKFLHPWIASQQAFRTRFETEARAMSRLSHPNCVSVIDFGLEGTSPYVVMDFVTGGTLRQILERGRLSPVRAVAIARQVLAGIAHAHAQKIIHRDLKPENLILGDAAGLADHVRILDFGLAKLRDGPAMTTGLALGTPSYMSPEQTGAPGEIDGRTDIYAVGIVLFEMLAGRKPFVSEKVGEILVMHRDMPPPSLRGLVPEAGISAQLEIAVNRALEKSPDSRFQSAAEFAQALDDVPEAAVARSAGNFPVDAPTGAIQIGPSLADSVNETMIETTMVDPSMIILKPSPRAKEIPTATVSRSHLGARAWMGLVGMGVVALVLVGVGIRGRASSPSSPGASHDGKQGTTALAPTSAPAPGHIPSKMEHVNVVGHASPSAEAPSVGGALPVNSVVAADAAKHVSLAERIQASDALLSQGEWEQALVVLQKARKENPTDADVVYRLANVALEHKRWGEGTDAARIAGARASQYQADERLVKNLIRALGTDKGFEKSEPVLQGFGPGAVPYLKEASAHDSSSIVRQRAAEILRSRPVSAGARGPLSRSSGSGRPSSGRSLFSR